MLVLRFIRRMLSARLRSEAMVRGSVSGADLGAVLS